MAKLIQLRQRIKAIETIKKITHAMRLIAMSTHSHLKSRQDPLSTYNHALNTIFAQLLAASPQWHNPIMHPHDSTKQRTLLIIIGSQKGLCGSFNTNLFKLISHHLATKKYTPDTLDIIAVGQKAVDFSRHTDYLLKHFYEKNNAHRIEPIAQEITHMLIHAPSFYTTVIIASNIFKNFFSQKPRLTTLIPFTTYASSTEDNSINDYVWDQSATEILDSLIPQYLGSQIHYFLFQSLLAEHAARFISMDTATRNANSLLETTRLEYNKLRQAKITKELTELVGSFS